MPCLPGEGVRRDEKCGSSGIGPLVSGPSFPMSLLSRHEPLLIFRRSKDPTKLQLYVVATSEQCFRK